MSTVAVVPVHYLCAYSRSVRVCSFKSSPALFNDHRRLPLVDLYTPTLSVIVRAFLYRPRITFLLSFPFGLSLNGYLPSISEGPIDY